MEKGYWYVHAYLLSDEDFKHGVSCAYNVIPGMDHYYPDDFGARLQDALRFILRD